MARETWCQIPRQKTHATLPLGARHHVLARARRPAGSYLPARNRSMWIGVPTAQISPCPAGSASPVPAAADNLNALPVRSVEDDPPAAEVMDRVRERCEYQQRTCSWKHVLLEVLCTSRATTLTRIKDYKVYHMEDIHFSPDPKITRLNQEIVRRVNRIAAERVDYKEAVLSKGPSDDKLLAMENITNLKKQIVKLQRDVKSHGGVYFDIPDRFNDDVPE